MRVGKLSRRENASFSDLLAFASRLFQARGPPPNPATYSPQSSPRDSTGLPRVAGSLAHPRFQTQAYHCSNLEVLFSVSEERSRQVVIIRKVWVSIREIITVHYNPLLRLLLPTSYFTPHFLGAPPSPSTFPTATDLSLTRPRKYSFLRPSLILCLGLHLLKRL